MASSVKKKYINNIPYWFFRFTSAKKAKQGLPRQKEFTFNVDRFKKSEVEAIRDSWDKKYRKGEFDPWTQSIPAPEPVASPEEQITLGDAVEQYILHIPNELADSTVNNTKEALRRLVVFAGGAALRKIPVTTYIDWVNQSDRWHTRSTLKSYTDRFFKWAHKNKYIDEPLVIPAYSTRQERKEKTRDSITEAELFQLMAAFDKVAAKRCKKKNAPVKTIRSGIERTKDMVKVYFYMGLRLQELLHCRPAWITPDYRFLRIGDMARWGLRDRFTPKSGREQDPPIVIPDEVLDIFKKYKSECTGMYQRLFDYRSPRRVQKNVKDACIKAFGATRAERLSPHSLRHSCATFWLNERGIPVQDVQRLLRHEDIKTTMGYYHPSTDAHYKAFHGGKLKSVGK